MKEAEPAPPAAPWLIARRGLLSVHEGAFPNVCLWWGRRAMAVRIGLRVAIWRGWTFAIVWK